VRAAAVASDCVRAATCWRLAGIAPRVLAAARRRHPAHRHHSSRRHSHAARRSRGRARPLLCCLRHPGARHRWNVTACLPSPQRQPRRRGCWPIRGAGSRLPSVIIRYPVASSWMAADCGAAAHGGGGYAAADHRLCWRPGPTAKLTQLQASRPRQGVHSCHQGPDRQRASAAADASSHAGLGGASGSPSEAAACCTSRSCCASRCRCAGATYSGAATRPWSAGAWGATRLWAGAEPRPRAPLLTVPHRSRGSFSHPGGASRRRCFPVRRRRCGSLAARAGRRRRGSGPATAAAAAAAAEAAGGTAAAPAACRTPAATAAEGPLEGGGCVAHAHTEGSHTGGVASGVPVLL